MIALLACSAVWSMGTGVVHPEARTGSAGVGRAVGLAGLAGAVPRCGGAAAGAGEWWLSSVSVTAPPAASTARASATGRTRERRLGGGGGDGGLAAPRLKGGRLASTSAWASRHGSGKTACVARCIGLVLVAGRPDAGTGSIG